MLKIAVCDDEPDLEKAIVSIISRRLEDMGLKFHVSEYFNGDKLLKELKSGKTYDVLFLDIEMPKTNGIEIAEYAFKTCGAIVIFVSGKEHYMNDALNEAHPFAFIGKDVFETKIQSILLKIIEQIKLVEKRNTQKVSIDIEGCKYIFDLNKLVYVSARGKAVDFFFTNNRTENYKIKFSAVFTQLERYKFILVHRSVAVNYLFITMIEKYNIYLDGIKMPIQIAEARYNEVNGKFC